MHFRHVCMAGCLLSLSLAGIARSDEAPRARPDEVGFSPERLAYLDQVFSDEVKDGKLAGIVTLVARHGKIVHLGAVGSADIAKKEPMATNSLFRLYSMTKPITSTALMMLYEEGKFQLTDPVSDYLPEFANLRVLGPGAGQLDKTEAAVRGPTMQDLMRHTAGFTHGLNAEDPIDREYLRSNVFGVDVSLAQMVTKLSTIPLRYQPGTKWVYSISPDIQARLVEVLSGIPFDQFLEKRLFKPLGMTDTGFWVNAVNAKRLATVYWLKDGKLTALDAVHGHPSGPFVYEPVSVNSYFVNHPRKGGSFGLVASAEDYWRFAQMLLNGGELNGARILGPRVVDFMTRDQLGTVPMLDVRGERPSGLGFGLGFAVTKDPAQVGFMGSEGTFFWWGVANTFFWIDPKEDLVVVAMTQHMAVPAADALLGQLRSLVYSALIN